MFEGEVLAVGTLLPCRCMKLTLVVGILYFCTYIV